MNLPQLRPFRVLKNVPLAEGVFGLTLVPADGEPMFSFVAGQWVMLHLLNEDGTTWAKAAFSIASAPCESQETIELAIKVYGDYTKRALELKEGDLVKAQGPYGVFILKPTTDRLVIFAGGIGITPFRSMIRQVLSTNDPREVVLFYSDKTHAQMTYEKELRELAKAHSRFKTFFFLTSDVPEGWEGEKGRINAPHLKAYVPDLSSSEFVTCGPEAFMAAVRDMLIVEGVDVKAKMRKELF